MLQIPTARRLLALGYLACRGFSYITIVAAILAAGQAVATTYVSDGSYGDVQAKVSVATNGDTVEIPPGAFNWSGTVAIGNGVHLRGAGGGGIIARSTDSMTIGTGTKVFTVTVDPWASFTPGQGITVHAIHNGESLQMIGTVTSYSAPTLTLNITSTVETGPAGSTWACWVFRVASATTIINDRDTSFIVTVTPNGTSPSEISGIWFKEGTSSQGTHIEVYNGTNSVKIHDCQFSTANHMLRSISLRTNHGIIYNCNFDSSLYAGSGTTGADGYDDGGIACHPEEVLADSWTTPSTMGTADTTGLNNFYIEDNRFTGVFQSMDFDSNSRCVWRHNILDNSSMASHGHDTSAYGCRHFEIYDNTWIFTVIGASGTYTYPIDHLFMMRGGTGVFTDNVVPDVNSTIWGNKAEFAFTVYNIRRAVSNISCQTVYPASRQVGRGYIDGSGPYNEAPWNNFKGDLEPFYMWGNSGGGNYDTPGFVDDTDTCGNGLLASDFVIENRDYYLGTAKPGYTKFTYPHPLRTGGGGDVGGTGTGNRKVRKAGSSLGGRTP